MRGRRERLRAEAQANRIATLISDAIRDGVMDESEVYRILRHAVRLTCEGVGVNALIGCWTVYAPPGAEELADAVEDHSIAQKMDALGREVVTRAEEEL